MKIGCLGAASIAPQALVKPAQFRADAVLQAVAARDVERARTFAAAHGFAEALPDYKAVIDHPDIELIYIPLPINRHAEWACRALSAGKHVLCEKPLAMNSGEARAVLAASQASGMRVIEAFHYRYHPAFGQLLHWISAGRIGRLRTIEAVFNVAIGDKNGKEIRHLPETGGGAFMDLGCYPLSWTLMMVGADLKQVAAHAQLTPRGVDERMSARLTFDDGVVANLSASMAERETLQAQLIVVGDKGEITFINPVAPHLGASLTLDGEEGTEAAFIDPVSTYDHQLSAVLEALQNGVALPTEGDVIMRQQRTLDGIYSAAGLRHLR